MGGHRRSLLPWVGAAQGMHRGDRTVLHFDCVGAIYYILVTELSAKESILLCVNGKF